MASTEGDAMRTWRRAMTVGAVALFGLSGCAWVQRADVRDDGMSPATALQRARDLSVSDDGESVSFITPAALVPADTNGTDDLYRRDFQGSGAGIRLIPTAADIDQWIAKPRGDAVEYFFTSRLQLTADDTNDHPDVYVRNVDDSSLRRISVGTTGEIAGSLSASLNAVTSDGSHVLLLVQQADGDHTYLRDRDAGTTTEIPLGDTESAVDLSSSGALVMILTNNNGLATVTLKATFAPDTETLACQVTNARFAANGAYVLGNFVGGPNCPTGLARYQSGGGYEPAPVPAGTEAVVQGVDKDGRYVLWSPNDASGQMFVTSFLTNRTQRVSEGGFPPVAGPVEAASLSLDGSTVALLADTPFPGAGPDNGANGVVVRTTFGPIVDVPNPAAVVRGAPPVSVQLVVHDSWEGGFFPIDFGPGTLVTVASSNSDGAGTTHLQLSVSAGANTPSGPRNVTVFERHRFGYSSGVCLNCINLN